MRNTNKTLAFVCAIVLITTSIVHAQTSKKSRFAKDEKVEKYVLRPMPSYKQAVYMDLAGLTFGNLHMGYNKVFSKKSYWEAGLKTSIFGSTNEFAQNLTSLKQVSKIANATSTGISYSKSNTLIGLHGGIHRCLVGNPLSRTITIGMRGDYLIQNSSYTVGRAPSTIAIDNQKAFVAVINPVFTLSTSLSRTLQIDMSGLYNYKYVRSGKASDPTYSNVSGFIGGIIMEVRLKKLF